MKKNPIALFLTLISFGLLVPGLILPIFALSFSTHVDAQLANFHVDILKESRSILGTVEELFNKDRVLVAVLIFLFSVLVPVLKGSLVLLVLLKKQWAQREKVFAFINTLGKWSMADVFVVGVFLAFLATKDNGSFYSEKVRVLGLSLDLNINSLMQSNLEIGFYYFVGYCLCSLAAMQFVCLEE